MRNFYHIFVFLLGAYCDILYWNNKEIEKIFFK